MSLDVSQQKCVAIYAPMVGGLYYSELITQIIQLCEVKSYKVKIFRTGGYGEYDMEFAMEDVDIVVLLRNAVHTQWVKAARAGGKAVVSISYDYFPLDVPVVASDHCSGVKLALDSLKASGASSYAFLGNLSNFDIRKRYESFCDDIEDKGLKLSEEHLFVVDEDLLSGGYQAAKKFVEMSCEADGLVFGTTTNAIGFCRFLKNTEPSLLRNLHITSFDANSMVPVMGPNIATIDQNYNLMAYKVISLGEKICAGIEVEQRHHVQPKLIHQESEAFDTAEAYMATSYEKLELSDPNYMKCLMYNMHEWAENVAKSRLDEIMALRPIFEGLLEVATFGRFVNVGSTKKMYKVLKTFLPDSIIEYSPQDKLSLSLEREFPVDTKEVSYSSFKKELHFMIRKGGRYWGCLSTFGNLESTAGKSSIVGLSMYIEWILTFLSPNSNPERHSENSRLEGESQKPIAIEGEILWDLGRNTFSWDDEALKLLGFCSDLDRGIYRNMELSDRVKDEDLPVLRQCLSSISEEGFSSALLFRHKNRKYINCELSAQQVGDGMQVTFKIVPI